MYILENKNIYSKYFINKTYECGLKLEGWEVKSIKLKNEVQIKNNYLIFIKNEIFIKNVFINIYNKNINSEKNRKKKLLLKKTEINEIINEINKKKLKLITLGFFIKNNFIKVKIALVDKKYIKNYEKIRNF